ncbi:MAG: L-fucose:H+ symporter permease, partial [Bacteroidota bacterium]
AFLETTANPFILAMGEEQTATRRLNLSQAFNPIGSLHGILVAQLLVIQSLQSDDYSAEAYAALEATTKATIRENDLGIISYPYLLLGGLVLVILVIVALTKFPSIREHATLTLKDSFRKLVINKRYLGGVLGIAFTVGCQIMCWTFIFHYVDHLNASRGADEQLVATWYNMAAMISFLTGRWISTYLLRYFQPGRLLMYYAVAGVILATGAILLPGIVGLYCLVGVSLAMSTMFPTIYGIALDGMGDEAKLGSAGLVMAIVGGALLPPLQAAMLDLGGDGLDDIQLLGFLPEIRFSFILPWLCLVGVAYYGYSSIKKQFLNT